MSFVRSQDFIIVSFLLFAAASGSSYRTTILLDDFSYTDELESYQSSTFMDYRREIELGVST